MFASWKIFIFFVSFLIFLQTADFKPPGRADYVILPTISSAEQNKTLERLFKALEGLLDFYQREYKNLIIDGVFGLRVLEGVAKKILADDQREKILLPSVIRRRVQNLYSKSMKIANLSIYFLKKQNPNYFEVMGFVAVEPWKNIHPFRKLEINKKVAQSAVNMSDKLDMEESDQDQCIRNLAGDKEKGIQPCTIREHCWKLNTVQGKSEYHLTHQLLFFMMGEAKGCLKVFEAKFKTDSFQGGVDKFLSQSCRLMYPEMLQQEKRAISRKYLDDIDLYMEQCVVCGMLGYAEFFTLYRLNLILGWMHLRMGCFGYSDNVKREPGHQENDEDVENEKSDGNKKTMRQLKVTKDLEGGCEAHSSGVGTGLLAHYLRWLLHISRFTTHETNPEGYDEAGFFIKHKYLGVIPSVKTTLMFVVIVILVLILFAKRLGFRMPKSLWM